MLHTETVSADTLGLIQKLQADPVFSHFLLVGGTARALHIGHRISVDIDFFTKIEFDNQELLEHLEQNYGFRELYRHTNTLKGIIGDVFVDIRHNYNSIANHIMADGLKMASKEDIAAMKVNAITGNGSRIKDFVDIYFLLKEFSFAEIIDFYKKKYETRNDFHAIKSLTYFDDVRVEDWPKMLLEKNLTFHNLKKTLIDHSNHFFKSLK